MDPTSPSMSELNLEELLSDSDAVRTCQKLFDCYTSDKKSNLLNIQDKIRPSDTFVSLTIKNGTEGIKKELEDINHSIKVVDSLLNKKVINYTSEIIQSFEEVNEYVENMSEISENLKNLNETIGKKYKRVVMLFNSVESDTTSLERLQKVYLYSLESRKLITFLKSLHKRMNFLQSEVRDFLEMLLISSQCMACLDRILKLERTDALLKVVKYCEDLKNLIIKKVYNKGLMPLFTRDQAQEGHREPGKEMEKILVISHAIFKELSVSSKSTLDLIENLVYETSDCLNLKEVTSQNYPEWERLLMSQVSEFMARYSRNQRSIYFICKSTRHSVLEKLDKKEREFVSRYLENYVHEEPKDPFSLCELYTKRCVGSLQYTLATLYKEGDKFDVVMLAPQLIELGDRTHSQLSSINIPFNMHKYYFKTLCEDYAKTFVSVAAKKIIPISKMTFLNCVKALPNLEAYSSMPQAGETSQASLILVNLPSDNELWKVVSEFLEKSFMCPELFKQVSSIVTSGLETVFSNISQIRSNQGNKLSLSDGGSKITLVKPSDAQVLNAKLFKYLFTIVDGIESKYSHLISENSNLERVLEYGRSIPLISSWPEDVASTIWHTTSYISVDNVEFAWTCNQVNIAGKNLLRILNFVKDSYFDPLVSVGRYQLLSKLSSSTVASFLVYALTVWPLSEEDKLVLLNLTTEIEFTLSELLREKLPRSESEYLSLFRRLIFLSDDEVLSLFCQGSFSLPRDVLLLHIACRILRDSGVSDKCLFRFMNFTSVHFMLQSFRTSLVSGHDSDSPNFDRLNSFLSSLNLTTPLYHNLIAHLNGF